MESNAKLSTHDARVASFKFLVLQRLPVMSTMSRIRNRRYTLRLLFRVICILLAAAMDPIVEATTSNLPPSLFCQRHVLPLGYSCVEHKVQTDDGYILVMHRIANWRSFDGRQSRESTIAEPTNDEADMSFSLSPESVGMGNQSLDGMPSESNPTAKYDRKLFQARVRPMHRRHRISNRRGKFLDVQGVTSNVSRPDSSYKVKLKGSLDSENGARKRMRFKVWSRLPNDEPPRDLHYAQTSKFDAETGAEIISSFQLQAGISPRALSSSIEPPVSISSPPVSAEINVNIFGPSTSIEAISPTSAPENIEVSTLNPQETTGPEVFTLNPQETTGPASAPETLRPGTGPTFGPVLAPAEDASESGAVASPSSSMFVQSPAIASSEGSPTSTSLPTETIVSPSSGQENYRESCGEPCRGGPVLLMHPEFFNGDFWFWRTDSPIGHLLPLLLVDAGYDVWVGHHRATLWGHDHVELQSDDPRYWDWTWDEQAKYDIPALLGLINAETQQTVHYIGVSQSATVGAAVATRAQEAKVLRSITLVGPTIYRGNTNSLVLAAWAFLFGNNLDERYYRDGYQHGTFNYSSEFPLDTIYGQGPMSVLLDTISGPNCCLGSTVVTFNNGWDGTTSFKNLIHFQQGVRTNTWRHFDYESDQENMHAFGNIAPPSYNPEDIPEDLPVFVVFGDQDVAAPRFGVLRFLTRLSGPRSLDIVNYAHFDLAFGSNRTDAVYRPILEFLDSCH